MDAEDVNCSILPLKDYFVSLSWLFRFASPQATNLHNKQGLRCFYLFLGAHLSETAILHGTDSKTKLSEKQ